MEMDLAEIVARVEIDFPVSFRDDHLYELIVSNLKIVPDELGRDAINQPEKFGPPPVLYRDWYDPDADYVLWDDLFRFKNESDAIFFKLKMS